MSKIRLIAGCLGLLLGVFGLKSLLHAEELSLLSLQQEAPYKFLLNVSQSEKKRLYYLRISSEQISENPSIEMIANPPRLVLDFPGIRFSSTKKFEVRQNPDLSALRFGSHSNLGRIVIDLKSDTAPVTSAGPMNGGFVVAFGWESSQSSSASQITAKSAAQTPLPSRPTIRAAETPVPAPNSSSSLGSSVGLTAIGFHAEKGMVLLSTTSNAHFALTERDGTTYLLTIDSCQVGNRSLTLPQLPDANFPNLRFVQAKQKGSACELTVGTDKGVKVSASKVDKGIELRVNR